MKILVIDEEFPYPPNSGKRLRSLNLLKRVAANHRLSYLAYGREDSESFARLQELNMHPIAVKPQVPSKSGMLFYGRLFLNLFSQYPYIVSSHYSSSFKKRLQESIADLRPDLILCEWTPYAIFVKDIEHINKVIVAHNIETQIWQRYYENETGLFKKWFIGIQRDRLARFERLAFNWVDGATAVSGYEADEIRSLNHKLQIAVIDNGVDLEYFKPSISPGVENRLVFVGAMDWRPNQDAVRYYVEEIHPLLQKQIPAVEAYFVGRNPPKGIMELNKNEGITVTGSVDDVRPYIEEGTVYIVPLRIGGGTRLKILDAMAMKKAIVSTPVGAEGLDVKDGENIFLAEDPEQFAIRVADLLGNTGLRKTFGEAGRRLVEEKYGWDSLAVRLERFLTDVAEE